MQERRGGNDEYCNESQGGGKNTKAVVGEWKRRRGIKVSGKNQLCKERANTQVEVKVGDRNRHIP